MPDKIRGSAIQSGTITSTQLSAALSSSISAGGGPKIASLAYPNGNTYTHNLGNDTITLTGSGFDANVAIYVNGNAAASVSRSNSEHLTFTLGTLLQGIYTVYAINPDGGVAIYAPGANVVSLGIQGGSITEVDGYKIHTFTSTGTITSYENKTVEYLIVGGGGGGGPGGGGGAGGVITGNLNLSFGQTYNVAIGAGGTGVSSGVVSTNGSNTTFSGSSPFTTLTAYGGGAGSAIELAINTKSWGGANGASGGGGGGNEGGQGTTVPGGKGIYPGSPYISATRQGYDGGTGTGGGNSPAGGGGGAGASGGNATPAASGAGGIGIASSIRGSSSYYGGGGGGGGYGVPVGAGGTGGGGGTRSASVGSVGRAGGSGIVIIRYPI